jgi:hypothetical protein
MRYLKVSLYVLFLGAMIASCKTQMVDPIDLTSLEQGGYIRTVSPLSGTSAVRNFNVSQANMAGSKMEIVAEAVTPDKGALFASYDLVVKFVDLTPANGNKSTTDVALKSFAASSFTKDATTGYPRATLSVTGAEALAATKVAAADVSVGDRFDITGTMKLTNGKSFTTTNTGTNIVGGDFYASAFAYRLLVVQ